MYRTAERTIDSADNTQVDRNEHFFGVEGLHFPHWENADTPLIDTVLDGELVIDIDPSSGQVRLSSSPLLASLVVVKLY